MTHHHVPTDWHTVTPRIVADRPDALVEFIKRVFDASGDYQEARPTELRIGESVVMISGLLERKSASAFLYVYVEDTDATYQRALEAGASSLEEPCETPYGDRRATIEDDWGNTWQIATHRGQFTP